MDASYLQGLVGEWSERLARISEQDSLKVVGSKWTRKQLLGHLIDSAANNYQRFVRLRCAQMKYAIVVVVVVVATFISKRR